MNAPVNPETLKAASQAFLAETHKLYIGGRFIDAESGQTIEVVNPATGQVIGRVQAAGAADVDKAVKAARKAFDEGPWRKMPAAERAKLMHRLADAIEAAADEIAYVESLDNGMSLGMGQRAAGDIAVNNLRYNAGWCGKIDGAVPTPSTPDIHAYTVKEPVGVVGAITPWNFPFGLAVAKISAALAAGCTVVLKPAELTPLSAVKLAQLVDEVGFPDGVVNIVTGYGDPAGKALVEHPEVDKITFTGSTATGKWIVQAAAGTLKRVSLELGGKSPSFVFPDADMSQAIPGAAMSVFANAGQICVAGSRLYVHQKVFDQVVEGVAGVAKSLKVGSGLDPEAHIGPIISQKQLERVEGYIRSGVEQGGEVVAGGRRTGNEGFFMQPTVFTKTDANMKLVREEIFGPVICAMPVNDDDLDRLAAVGNDTTYGLAAYIWTKDVSIAHKLAGKLRAGSVNVNGGASLDPAIPFGGYKQSGWGRENGRMGVEAFMETKSVSIRL